MAKAKGKASADKGVPDRELTDKEHHFCVEYSVSGNATKSYQRAYKCNYNTAGNAGPLLLKRVEIKARVDELRTARNKRLEIDKDDILRRFKVLCDYDAADFYDDDGRLKPLSELDPDLRFVIEGLDVSESITGEEGDGISRLMKIKLPSKTAALTALAKHSMLFEPKPKEEDGTESEDARTFAQAMASTQTSTGDGQAP